MADYSDPKRATAYRFTLSLYARADNQIKTAPTLAAGDVKVSKDNGATANITTLPAETPASSGILQVDLSATEMTADLVTIIFRDAAGSEWNDVAVHLATAARQMADLAYPATSGRSMVVDAAGLVDANTVKVGPTGAGTAQTAGDIMADTNDIQTRLDTIDDFLDTEIAAIKAKTDNLPADPADASDIAARFTTLDTAVADLPTNAELATALGTADDAVLAQIALVKAKTDLIPAAPAAVGDIPTADITAIKAKTDSLTFTVAGQVDANIQYVNDVQVTGTGAPGSEWGP